MWVLDPGALYEKVCGEAWLESAREEEAFQTQLLFARWYEAQINLCAQLAFGDNMRCNNVLGKIMPFELCFSAIWNERLPMCIRTAFVNLTTNLWVAVHPHRVSLAPRVIRLYSDMKRNPVLGNGDALPQASAEQMRRLRLLKFFRNSWNALVMLLFLSSSSAALTANRSIMRLRP